jgi:GLPGLI family protein
VVDIKAIINASSQTEYVLMDMMGYKQCNKSTAAEISDENKKNCLVYTVKLTSDTKTIAGYNCKRAIVTVKSDQTGEQTMDVYFTDEIDVSKFYFGNVFPKVGGLPLEFSTKKGNTSLKTTAKSVKKEYIDETEFSIPADYKIVTTEELRTK